MSKTDIADDKQQHRAAMGGEWLKQKRQPWESKTSPSIPTTSGKAVAERGGGERSAASSSRHGRPTPPLHDAWTMSTHRLPLKP
eukprot:7423860-Heterocapsa_arctica.AAC.1